MSGPVRLVRIVDAEGRGLYRNLVDDGGDLLRFASGYGFVTRDQVRRNHWRIVAHEQPQSEAA